MFRLCCGTSRVQSRDDVRLARKGKTVCERRSSGIGFRMVLIWGVTWCMMGSMMGSMARGQEVPVSAEEPAVDYVVIVTGSELLTGVYADGHTHFLTRTLRPLGLHCVGAMFVDDDAVAMQGALKFACGQARLVLVTGGLGPTDSDITRDVIAEFTGIELAEHEDVLRDMESRWKTPRAALRANLRRQSRVPQQGGYLKNANGSAVGLVFDAQPATIVALPGPPRELQPMVRDELIPLLARRFGTHTQGSSVTLRFIGIGQSLIDQTMKEHIQLTEDIIESSQFEGGRVDFTFALPHDRPEDRARLKKLREAFHEHLGEFIYADNLTTTLEDCVVGRLAESGQTLAVVEVGSGGSLAAALSHAQQADRVIAGVFVAPTEERMRAVLGVADTAWQQTPRTDQLALLASTAQARTGASQVIVIGAVEQDPEADARRVAVVLQSSTGEIVNKWQRWSGPSVNAQSGMIAELLDTLRRAQKS